MWLALGTLANNKTPAINGAKSFRYLPAVSEGRVSAPSGPPPAVLGREQGRATSQTSAWATGSQGNPVVMNVSQDPADPWVSSTSSSLWPLAYCDEVCTVTDTFSADDPSLWSSLLSPTARAAALPDNQGHCLNGHETSLFFQLCSHPFINANGCINPELGQLGDNSAAYRRWPERMLCYRRGNKTGGP